MPDVFKRFKRFILNLSIAILSCILVLLLGEVFLRLNPALTGYRYGCFQYDSPDPLGKSGRGGLLFRPSASLGYEFTPNSQAGNIVINALGLLGKNIN